MRTGLKAADSSNAHQLAETYKAKFQKVQADVMENLQEEHGVQVNFNQGGVAVDGREVTINPDGIFIQLLSDAVNKNSHNSAALEAVIEDNSGLGDIYRDALAGLRTMEKLFEY